MKTTLRLSITLVLALGLLGASGLANDAIAGESAAAATVRLGVVLDGPHGREYDFADLLREEIEEITRGRYRVVVEPGTVRDGGWTRDGIRAAVDELLARPGLDVLLAVGVDVASEICTRPDLPLPVVVPLSIAECTPNCVAEPRAWINRLQLSQWMASDLRAFREVVPFRQVVVIGDPWISGCDTARLAEKIAPPGGEVRFIALAPGEQRGLADRLPQGTDAVYLMRLQQIDDAAFAALVDELTRAGLPTFSMLGEREVRAGVLAGLNTEATLEALARGAAVDLLDALEGTPRTERAFVDFGGRLTVNMKTAARLGLGVSWEVLTSARLIDEQAYRAGQTIDLRAALDRAQKANLSLLAEDHVVAAGAQDVRVARAALRPQLDASVTGAAIDSHRAFAALGQYQRSTTAGLTLRQLIYSDTARAGLTAQREAQRGRVADRETLRLGVRRVAASAYLDLMRAEVLVRVRQDDVDLTRANLGVARLQHSLGSGDLAVVRRWEAALATARAALLEARSVRRLAERQLSQVLDRPLTTSWRAAPLALEAGLDILGGADLARMLDTPEGFAGLIPHALQQGLAASPELKSLDAAIAAQERLLAEARRRGRLPQVGLQADWERVLTKDEGGSDLALPPGLLPEVSDNRWSAGLSIRLPVVTGGANAARRVAAREKLEQLRLRRRESELRISQRILSALDQAAASWPAIALRRSSADAAADSLRLVQDAYGRGAASILDLLDAQNAALAARLAARTSIYDFLDDWAETRRATGQL